MHSFNAYLSYLNYLMLWYKLYAIILLFRIVMIFFLLLCIDMFTVHMDPNVVGSSPGTGTHKKISSFLAHLSKAQVSYCHSDPSVVRPSSSSSVRPSGVNFLHFRLLLQNRLKDFDETWYTWCTQGPLQKLCSRSRSLLGWIQGGPKVSNRVPLFKNLLLWNRCMYLKTNCI